MAEQLNSKAFELLFEAFLANKHFLSKVVANRMNSYFKEVAKVIDLYKTYIEFLENENAFINTSEDSTNEQESQTTTGKERRTREEPDA